MATSMHFSGTSNFGNPPAFGGSGAPGYGGGVGPGYGGGAGNQLNQPSPFGAPGFNPFVPQYGQAYPYTPFPTFAAPFDFMSFLNQYFQALQSFQAQAEAQAQQAAAGGYGVYHSGPGHAAWAYTYPRSPAFVPFWSGGYPSDNNEVGGVAMATYSPQGGYGSANIFPKPEGGLETRFGGDEDGGAQNSVGPVSGVSGSFKPPSGGSFGVFTSSSSGSSDINGKKTSYKQSTIGVNDNGKVTTYTAHDP
ncbi:glycine-rich RNA-binding protein 3, mitochondrial-like [Homalodisca vitripennis]|uniref:glycine-rich RNA-binding protein 3, mitochondrial-like n=1 Tax=Homalodisca vitripennis TaxID=197043 RepID=UPI001EE9F566|nr:glycine-rich RNA-binding protein 3, mitochondrial-like [Homalodisca vitripennis]